MNRLQILRRPLKLPIIDGSGLRVSQVSPRPLVEGAKPFPPGRWHELERYAPNVLAGSVSELRRLIERVDLGTADLTSVDRAVFVLTEVGDPPVTEVMRVVLWQRLGVPVYELYVGADGQLLAADCEAQEGWHIEPGVRFQCESGELVQANGQHPIRTGLKADLLQTVCECGRAGLRIVHRQTCVPEISCPVLAESA